MLTNMTGDTLVLNDSLFAEPVVITDTILIQKDTLYIKAGGNFTLMADSAYTGPAFALSPNCKYIVIDGILFQNFNVALTAFNNALHLKDVRFANCRLPVQRHFTFPDGVFVNGSLKDSAFKTDSLFQ